MDSESEWLQDACPNWASPEELVEGPIARSPASDVWSLAMVFWEIMTCSVPFASLGVDRDAIRRAVCDGGERPPCESDIPPDVAAVLGACWASNPSQRLTVPVLIRRMRDVRTRLVLARPLMMSPGIEVRHQSNPGSADSWSTL